MAFSVKVKVDIDASSIINQRTKDKVAKTYAHTRLHAYCAKYVPRDSGTLNENVEINEDALTYKSPYAHYIYEGILYLAPNGSAWAKKGERKHSSGKPLNLSGTAHWDEAMKVADGQRLADDLTSHYKKKG